MSLRCHWQSHLHSMVNPRAGRLMSDVCHAKSTHHPTTAGFGSTFTSLIKCSRTPIRLLFGLKPSCQLWKTNLRIWTCVSTFEIEYRCSPVLVPWHPIKGWGHLWNKSCGRVDRHDSYLFGTFTSYALQGDEGDNPTDSFITVRSIFVFSIYDGYQRPSQYYFRNA